MPLFRSSAQGVAEECVAGTLALRMGESFRHAYGHRPGPGERHAWERSLSVLARDLVDAGLGGVEMLLEYRLPLTSRRVDAVLAGADPASGEPSYVLVELKQWSSAHGYDDAPDLCVVPGAPGGPRLQPVEQVRGYIDYLTDFNRALAAMPGCVTGLAYLHNATDASVADLLGYGGQAGPRLFTGQRRAELHGHLRRLLAPDGGTAADLLLGAAVAPSRQLLAVAATEVRERKQFVLIGEQQTAFSLVLSAVEGARRADTKQVVIVTGGPGSGKSVIALSLLGELSRQGRSVLHATGSSSFTETMRKVVGHRVPRVRGLFKYFNNFVVAERNGLDVLICDEAHRIRETSANRFTPSTRRTGRRQVDELVAAARVPVFLLDEHQVVRPGEMGTVADIRAAAAAAGVPVQQVDLDGQFRCGGSQAYERWVLRLLGLRPGGPVPWEGDDGFAVAVAGSPEQMEEQLLARSREGWAARIAAGFCWPWNDPLPDGRLPEDVVIGSWRRPWNVKGERAVGGAPPRSLWATDPAGFGQVGCVYTAQGFEYDWAGVILGPDLVWRSDRWVAQPAESRDPMLRRAKGAEFDALVRNVYKVLLTRGMVGTLVCSTDPETQSLLERLTVGSREESVTAGIDR